MFSINPSLSGKKVKEIYRVIKASRRWNPRRKTILVVITRPFSLTSHLYAQLIRRRKDTQGEERNRKSLDNSELTNSYESFRTYVGINPSHDVVLL